MSRRRWVLPLALVVAAGCGGSSAKGPSASVTAPPTTAAAATTTSLPVEDQVKAAYLHSWVVYADAVRRLDPSHLAEVFAEKQLEILTDEIRTRTEQHRPALVDVEHHVDVKVTATASAVVRDAWINHSVRVDPVTGAPTESRPSDRIDESDTMKLIEGTWKVTFVIRQR